MPSPRLTDQIGRVVAGRYRLVGPIGAGASAEVFVADDVRLKRRVAVKMLHAALADDERFLRRFRREAQSAAALNHPNLVAVYDWGEDELPYLVTEYLSGGSLRTILDRGGRLSPAQALLVGLEATRGLEYAHRRGIVHRDVKPANLIFGDDRRLRIADFGLARALAEAAVTEPDGVVLGTARYASPEQAQGRSLDGRSDVYALGLVLVEAVTGQVPFTADTTIGTLMARVDAVADLDESLGSLRKPLSRALTPDPDQRPDAGELGVSLMAAAELMDRPEPIPLAPREDFDDDATVASGDPTMHHPIRVDGEAAADPDGADVTVVHDSIGEEATAVAPVALGTTQPPPATRLDGADGDDAPRRRWPVLAAAALLAVVLGAAGAYAFVQARVPSHEVPVLAGLQEIEARAEVDDFGWRIETRETRENGTEPGEVISTDPTAGSSLDEGETLLLVVSRGNELVTVPSDLVGSTREEAEAALTEVGLVPAVTEAADEEVPAGTVVALGDGVAEQAPLESEIPLIVSSGPAPREVPGDLAGKAFEDAAAAIEGVQLVPEKVEVFSDDVPKGQVVRTQPEAGTEVARDSVVKVEVSKGPDLVTVPNVRGLSLDEANAALESAGLSPGQVFGPSKGKPDSTDPGAGTEVRRGTTVDIYLKK